MSFITLSIGVFAVFCAVYYAEIGEFLRAMDRQVTSRWSSTPKSPKIWELEHLEKFKHVAIFGHVFDVSSKPQFYGPKGHYNGFTGVDATRAFATSDLSEEARMSTLEGLSPRHFASAFEWLKSFQEKYPHIGYLNDIYFDVLGRPTDLFRELQNSVASYKKTMKAEYDLYPSCNMYSAGDQHTVECVKGFDHVLYPRLLSTPTDRDPRCACVQQNFLNSGRTMMYPNCPEFARECHFSTAAIDSVLSKFRGR